MRGLLFAAYFITLGYGVGKLDIDERIVSLVKRETTKFIAYAKSVPAAPNQPMLPGLGTDASD